MSSRISLQQAVSPVSDSRLFTSCDLACDLARDFYRFLGVFWTRTSAMMLMTAPTSSSAQRPTFISLSTTREHGAPDSIVCTKNTTPWRHRAYEEREASGSIKSKVLTRVDSSTRGSPGETKASSTARSRPLIHIRRMEYIPLAS